MAPANPSPDVDVEKDSVTPVTTTLPTPQTILSRAGKRVHVGHSPEDLRRLQIIHTDVADFVLHGSPEHLEALHESHAHHEQVLTSMSEKHGDVYLELEAVFDHQHALQEQFRNVASHTLEVDASFDKYGYSAHIRTKEQSGIATPSAMAHGRASSFLSSQDEAAKGVKSMKIWSRPIVRQYFHKGLLWRANNLQEVASYELFVDLLFVGLIGLAGDGAAEEATIESLLIFVVQFLMGWRVWSDIATIVAWFEAEDLMRRITVLAILCALLGFTTNLANFRGTTYTPCICFYLAAKFITVTQFVWYGYLLEIVRFTLWGTAVCSMISVPLWIGSIYVETFDARWALLYPAILLDLLAPVMLLVMHRTSFSVPRLREWLDVQMEFVPALSIEHRTERTGAFVSLVFGYAILSLFFQNHAEMPMNAFYAKATLGLVQVFCLNIMYFEIDIFNLRTHAIRRHISSAFIWLTSHTILALSFTLSGAALAKLVRAHDSAATPIESLADATAASSGERLSRGQRWFYTAGLGIALLAITIISSTHVYLPSRGPAFRWARLALRASVALTIVMLGFAEGLDSLQLVAVTSGLIVGVLGVEVCANIKADEGRVFGFERNEGCAYECKVRVGQAGLERAGGGKGGKVRIEELVNGKGEFRMV